MSTAVLFGAGAVVTFITLWGVLMSVGLFAMRHQPLDDEMADRSASSIAGLVSPFPPPTAVAVTQAQNPPPVM